MLVGPVVGWLAVPSGLGSLAARLGWPPGALLCRSATELHIRLSLRKSEIVDIDDILSSGIFWIIWIVLFPCTYSRHGIQAWVDGFCF